MSGQRHPDTEEIAGLAGPVSGLRARRLAAHVADCDRCAAISDQLGAMRSMLASVPSPALPDSFERQISAAIATEAAARAADATPAGVGAARDSAEPVRQSPRRRHARSRGGRGFRLRPVMALGPAIACLVAVIGYFASRPAGPAFSGSYSGVAGAPAEPAASASSSSASGRIRTAGPEKQIAPSSAFTVTESGTRYQASTLRAQVRGELKSLTFNTTGGSSTALPSAIPSASPTALHSTAASSTGNGAAAPKQALIGCVLEVTGGRRPALVDKAFYQGNPAYVIAVPGKVWVVGRGCTGSDTELITSVSLSAAP
jgi:hypothetical protein